MDTLLELLALAVALVIIAVLLRASFDLVTVHDFQRGLRFVNGKFRGLVDAGIYPVFRPTSRIHVLDSRPAWQVIDGQEVPTADGVVVRVSLAAQYVVGDPVAAFTGDQDYQRALYLALQLGLRDALATRSLEEALAARSDVGPEIADRCAIGLAKIGVELLSVQVRDLTVPAELRRAFAGVVAARKEGEAALERARGETAALRNLANAGQLVDANPGLLSLRILQQLGQSTGNTVVVSLPDGSGRSAPAGGSTPGGGSTPPDAPVAAAVRARTSSRGRPAATDPG